MWKPATSTADQMAADANISVLEVGVSSTATPVRTLLTASTSWLSSSFWACKRPLRRSAFFSFRWNVRHARDSALISERSLFNSLASCSANRSWVWKENTTKCYKANMLYYIFGRKHSEITDRLKTPEESSITLPANWRNEINLTAQNICTAFKFIPMCIDFHRDWPLLRAPQIYVVKNQSLHKI